jgi:hypothetical protein
VRSPGAGRGAGGRGAVGAEIQNNASIFALSENVSSSPLRKIFNSESLTNIAEHSLSTSA